jgi:hypothetical protein
VAFGLAGVRSVGDGDDVVRRLSDVIVTAVGWVR